MWTDTLIEARVRARAFLIATAKVERKSGAGWTTIAAAEPCAAENINAGSSLLPEPVNRQDTETIGWKLSFGYQDDGMTPADVRTGDRLTITAPSASGPIPVLIAGKEIIESLAVLHQVVATAEDSAVETYPITVLRWSDGAGAYQAAGTYTVQAVLRWSPQRPAGDSGAVAATRDGTIYFSAGDDVQPGDYVQGLPWGEVRVAAVFPAVGTRKDARFVFASGA